LSDVARESIDDPVNELLLSIASLWEATIKIAIGKLRVPGDSIEFLLDRLAPAGVRILPIASAHLMGLQALPRLHRDRSTESSSLNRKLNRCLS
jgi:PIN domain nuclease of toxin-antitoxin system